MWTKPWRPCWRRKPDFPFEVICADDGSSDDTVAKLRVWEEKYPDIVRIFVMDRDPNVKYEATARIRRMNAIRGRLFREAKGSYVCYLDGDDFYTDPYKLQKQADILDADTAHQYVACGHNGCYYWESTGKTKPIEKPIRACSLTAKEYWSFLYIHTNALMFRNLGLQGIDPYASGVPINDNLLTFQFLPYGGIYYLPDCMFNYRQVEGSTYHRRSPYQNYILNATMLYQQKRVTRGFFGSGLVRFVFEYEQLFRNRKDPQLAKEAQNYQENMPCLPRRPCAPHRELYQRKRTGPALVRDRESVLVLYDPVYSAILSGNPRCAPCWKKPASSLNSSLPLE